MEVPNFQSSVKLEEDTLSKQVLKVYKQMVVACVAVNCSNSHINSPELSFHRLLKLNESNKQI